MTSKSKPAAAASLLQHFWMVAAQVEFQAGDSPAPFHKNFNVLTTTDRQVFTHTDLARAQQLAQHRLVKETFAEGVPEGFAITDVFMMNVSHLGQMTREEFAEGFSDLAKEQKAASEAIMQRIAEGKKPGVGVGQSAH